jgi:hypothetical protein
MHFLCLRLQGHENNMTGFGGRPCPLFAFLTSLKFEHLNLKRLFSVSVEKRLPRRKKNGRRRRNLVVLVSYGRLRCVGLNPCGPECEEVVRSHSSLLIRPMQLRFQRLKNRFGEPASVLRRRMTVEKSANCKNSERTLEAGHAELAKFRDYRRKHRPSLESPAVPIVLPTQSWSDRVEVPVRSYSGPDLPG